MDRTRHRARANTIHPAMKQRILAAYPTRLVFLITAGITAVAIIQIQSVFQFPAKLRRALH